MLSLISAFLFLPHCDTRGQMASGQGHEKFCDVANYKCHGNIGTSMIVHTEGALQDIGT